MTPAEQLSGQTLDGGWIVGERITQAPGATGGHFSIGYHVTAADGSGAFLKAIDFSSAMNKSDPARALQELTEQFNFERDLLDHCRNKGMDRVVRAVDSGLVRLTSGPVQYLIFELAERDVRAERDRRGEQDVTWMLRSLHHIATGLKQLHSAWIAHQDLKPSNVLVFEDMISKIADIGRASTRDGLRLYDEYQYAGDGRYAPPELLYGYKDGDWIRCRFGCDMYLLGSMVVFFLTGVSMTGLLFSYLDQKLWPDDWGDTYTRVLPYIRDAFGHALDAVEVQIAHPDLRNELMTIIRELCDPDPNLRGHPAIRASQNPYNLERYVTRFNNLARRSEIGYYKTEV